MKKCKWLLALALSFFMVFGAMPCTQVKAANLSDNYVVVYRMFNTRTGEHFYTTSAQEREELYLKGWNAEGCGWVAPAESEYTQPVYRLFHPGLGDHHYTVSEEERQDCIQNKGWRDEGILCQAVKTKMDGTTPLYRAFLPNVPVGAHHYTANYNEIEEIVSTKGWNDEGLAWYALNIDPGSVALPELPERAGIATVDSYASLEADVFLAGSGSGYHAKLTMQTATSAISWGIQYDSCAAAPYTGQTAYLVENVAHNGPGGQTYTRYGLSTTGEWHHMMITYKDGWCEFYLDNNFVGAQYNEGLKNGTLYCAVEGAARLDGDSVDARFDNIKIKGHGKYDPEQGFNHYHTDHNGLSADVSKFVVSTGSVNIGGVMNGLGGRDWDSAYQDASLVVRFSDGL